MLRLPGASQGSGRGPGGAPEASRRRLGASWGRLGAFRGRLGAVGGRRGGLGRGLGASMGGPGGSWGGSSADQKRLVCFNFSHPTFWRPFRRQNFVYFAHRISSILYTVFFVNFVHRFSSILYTVFRRFCTPFFCDFYTVFRRFCTQFFVDFVYSFCCFLVSPSRAKSGALESVNVHFVGAW